MRHPAKPKPSRPVVGDAPVPPNDSRPEEDPPPSAPAVALPMTKGERLATARAALRLVENKPRHWVPFGPFAKSEEEKRAEIRQHAAEGQLRAWEQAGAEAIWTTEDDIVFGTWLEAPAPLPETPAFPIRTDDGGFNRGAIRLVSRWLQHHAEQRQAEEESLNQDTDWPSDDEAPPALEEAA